MKYSCTTRLTVPIFSSSIASLLLADKGGSKRTTTGCHGAFGVGVMVEVAGVPGVVAEGVVEGAGVGAGEEVVEEEVTGLFCNTPSGTVTNTLSP
jgi:hypothetical protein